MIDDQQVYGNEELDDCAVYPKETVEGASPSEASFSHHNLRGLSKTDLKL